MTSEEIDSPPDALDAPVAGVRKAMRRMGFRRVVECDGWIAFPVPQSEIGMEKLLKLPDAPVAPDAFRCAPRCYVEPGGDGGVMCGAMPVSVGTGN